MPALENVFLRPALPAELDVLCEIDLDASTLYERVGLAMDFAEDHEFSVDERRRWLECLRAGTTLLAVDASDTALGFAACGRQDGEPYLDQLSVRTSCMKRGIGSALIKAVIQMCESTGARALWLTTYAHLPWNAPYYQRLGFLPVPEVRLGPDLTAILEAQRRWLPAPEQRVAMKRTYVVRTEGVKRQNPA